MKFLNTYFILNLIMGIFTVLVCSSIIMAFYLAFGMLFQILTGYDLINHTKHLFEGIK
jgi:hypothetical protein